MKKIIFLLLLISMFIGCGKEKISNEKKYTEERFLFGTYIQMIVFSENKEKAENAMNAAFEKIDELDRKYNSKTKNSIIYNLNHSNEREVKLDDEGIMLFNEVKKIYDMSNGKYDVTISPLLDTWGFDKNGRENIPSNQEIQDALSVIGFDKVIIDNDKLILNNSVKEIDTGSFLKGYAVEKAKEILEENGIKNGFISSISSIATIGGKADGTPWKIGVQNPSDLEKILGIVEVENKSLGISGDYQTYVEIKGKKYHHIMDKNTGYPVEDKKLVVVICDSAFQADMYSTAFFNMNIEEVLKKAELLNIDVLIVTNMGDIKTTKSFKLK
ncbi:FAD:protein FMN transferase [Fusobacterium sp.]|uniref:FAD:protein FMN transferase n=1 Tax=Fusobacterium sp. TaxID=68766 RepID=UPI00262F343D|nr:FAD:protein FMN transferase [Fusobacterium sp.]